MDKITFLKENYVLYTKAVVLYNLAGEEITNLLKTKYNWLFGTHHVYYDFVPPKELMDDCKRIATRLSTGDVRVVVTTVNSTLVKILVIDSGENLYFVGKFGESSGVDDEVFEWCLDEFVPIQQQSLTDIEASVLSCANERKNIKYIKDFIRGKEARLPLFLQRGAS